MIRDQKMIRIKSLAPNLARMHSDPGTNQFCFVCCIVSTYWCRSPRDMPCRQMWCLPGAVATGKMWEGPTMKLPQTIGKP